MTIAELFVNLGVKNEGPTQKALQNVRGTLGEISTSGLAAKAGVLGVVYGLQQLMSHSATAGAGLMSFAGATGLSAENLQRMQYAARQFNVGAEEMENTLTGVQSAMIKMSMGMGAPGGMNVIANAVGIDKDRVRDTEYMIRKLADYAKKEGNVDFANEQLKSFGLSLGMISAMRRGAFNDKDMKNAPIYSNAEANQLQKVDVAWSNLGKTFEMAIGHLTAKHGLGIIKDLQGVSKEVIHMITAFTKLGESIKLLKGIGMVFEGWGLIFEGIANATDRMSTKEGQNSMRDALTGDDNPHQTVGDLMVSKLWNAISPREKKDVTPAPAKAVTNNVTTTVNNHGVKDAKDGAHHVQKAITHASKKLPQGEIN